MELIKYEHACVELRSENTRLVVDPGVYTKTLTDTSGITAVVVTHMHPDHFDPKRLKEIATSNPNLTIFAPAEVTSQLADLQTNTVEVNKEYKVANFTLEFFGGQHASIRPGLPVIQNFGVLINDTMYYPGDSFTPCPKPHDVLLLPVMAPWLKFSETNDFIAADSATKLIPTHNGFLNDDGQDLYKRLVSSVVDSTNKQLYYLAPGASMNI